MTVGVPLPFDVFDDEGQLLLRKGFVIESTQQLERLCERGLYSDAAEVRRREGAHGSDPETRRVTARVSVFAMLGEAARQLEALLCAVQPAPTFAAGILDVARLLQNSCELESDPALAHILLVRKARYSLRQSLNVAILTEILLKQLGRSESERLPAVAGALTMNIVMFDLQDALYQRNDPLTAEQRRQILEHPLAAERLLRARSIADAAWLEVVAQHHEMVDGSGYPAKLQGSDLRQEAQVVSLADRYCAMVSERAYRPGTLPNAALRDIFLKQGAAIDALLAAILVKEIGIYPPGTVVALANGEVALVLKRTLNANQPIVRALRTVSGTRHAEPPKRQTSKPAYAVKEVRQARTLGFDIDCEKLWAPTLTDALEYDGADVMCR